MKLNLIAILNQFCQILRKFYLLFYNYDYTCNQIKILKKPLTNNNEKTITFLYLNLNIIHIKIIKVKKK